VAASLDGYIAGPNGEFDWIVVDPEFDFAELYASFSAIVMGRRSYEVYMTGAEEQRPAIPVYAYSRTLPEGERDGVTIVRDAVAHVRELKAGSSTTRAPASGTSASPDEKPVWLWGGGTLFRTLAAEGLVDGVDVAVIPILLGGGIQLLPAPGPRLTLTPRRQRHYAKTGTLFLEYDVTNARAATG
jgi:dihydrofolate reductase